MNDTQHEFRSLPLNLAYDLLEKNGFVTEAALLRNSIPGKELSKRRAKRGMALEVLRTKGLVGRFLTEFWPYGNTDAGKSRIARYDLAYEEWKASKSDDVKDDVEDLNPDADRFAYEGDLRDYLAKNLGVLEPGMTLWPVAASEKAVEFQLDGGRRIDILARDRNGTPVVIELKVSRGHERVIGQALYYRACIREKFGVPNVRTVIVAREIGAELRLATKELADVQLFEYQLSMTLTKV